MSSSENNSPNRPAEGVQGSPSQSSPQGKFQVIRTSKIAKADVPLVPEDGSGPGPQGSSPVVPFDTPTALASQGRVAESPAGTPPLAPQRPPQTLTNAIGGGGGGGASSGPGSRGPTPPMQGTPPLVPRPTPVPLITPRYQKKSRTNRAMNVTDSFEQHSANANHVRRQHSTERLTVTNGPQQYQQEVHFHTYEMYRHGSRQIHSRSVGYSSDGDLVMTREDYSEASDADNSVTRVHTEISNPTVLDPTARRPLTDSELNSKKKLNLRRPRYKKYPGVYAPRNKKLRNRLMNDYFVNEQAMRLLNAARERREDGDDDDGAAPAKPSFADLPPSLLKTFDLADEAQERELERLGATRSPNMNHVQPPRDPDSAEARFQKLNLRFRGELQHALSSEFLSQQIEDLEVCFSEFIDRGPTPESLVFHFRDGYGRLVCHGVAAYYQLVSESRTAGDGSTKLTYVSFPKPKKTGVRQIRLPHAPLTHILRGNRSNVPARHPLSATNSPQQTAQPSPSRVSTAVPNLGGDAGEMVELEPMSPLDLNENAKYSVPPPLLDTKASTAIFEQREGQQPSEKPATSAAEVVCSGRGGGGGAEPTDSAEVGSPFSPNDPTRTVVSSSSSSNSSVAEADKDDTGNKRHVLVNPSVVMTVQGKLPIAEVPIYAPHFQLRQLAGIVERGVQPQSGVADDEVSQPSAADTFSSSSSSSADSAEEEG